MEWEGGIGAPLGTLGDLLSCRGGGGSREEGSGVVAGGRRIGGTLWAGSSPLTAVMHGVAGYDHRRGHGDGGAAHGELVGDGVIRTAAAEARLARRGSWRNINISVISLSPKTKASGRPACRLS